MSSTNSKIRKLKKPTASIEPLQKSKGFVAFLDILGFQSMLEGSNFEKKIAGVVRQLRSRAEFDGKHYPDLKYLAISDTIIITAAEGGGYPLVRKIGQVQNALLKLGFATRGAISFGPILTYDGNLGRNIFGEAYLDAYRGEQELAIYPRVVVLKNAYSQLKADIQLSTHRALQTYILRDVDGVNFINQFSSDLIGSTAQFKVSRSRSMQNCTLYADQIDTGLSTADPKAKMKWRWLSSQFDGTFPNFAEN